jgi:hypothetical protein
VGSQYGEADARFCLILPTTGARSRAGHPGRAWQAGAGQGRQAHQRGQVVGHHLAAAVVPHRVAAVLCRRRKQRACGVGWGFTAQQAAVRVMRQVKLRQRKADRQGAGRQARLQLPSHPATQSGLPPSPEALQAAHMPASPASVYTAHWR